MRTPTLAILALSLNVALVAALATPEAHLVQRQATTTTAQYTGTPIGYTPGQQVGPSTYSNPTLATAEPSQVSASGPVGGQISGSSGAATSDFKAGPSDIVRMGSIASTVVLALAIGSAYVL